MLLKQSRLKTVNKLCTSAKNLEFNFLNNSKEQKFYINVDEMHPKVDQTFSNEEGYCGCYLTYFLI